MARWKWNNDSKDNTLMGGIQYDASGSVKDSTWEIRQDEKPYIDEVNRERENQKKGFNSSAMKKFATIPDIVAIDLLANYGIDIHDPLFMHDHMNMKKLKTVILQDFPHLVVNK